MPTVSFKNYKKMEKKKKMINHGIDCNCKKCKKIRDLLKNKEKKGEINLVGTSEDLEKIRK